MELQNGSGRPEKGSPNGRPKWVPGGPQKASKIDPSGLPQIDGKVEKTVPKLTPKWAREGTTKMDPKLVRNGPPGGTLKNHQNAPPEGPGWTPGK